MNFIQMLDELKRVEALCREYLDVLKYGPDHDDWLFLIHKNYDEPRVSAWQRDDDHDCSICFKITRDCEVELRSPGLYEQKDIDDAKAILEDWMNTVLPKKEISR